MRKLLIDRTPDCVRYAVLHDGKLKELYIEPTDAASLVGQVYVGRIQNLLPGQFAFIDIGMEKNAFINLPRDHGLRKGDSILLQIYKDAHGTKGPYGGQQLKLKGSTVIIHESPRRAIGVSQKITDPQERTRLRHAVYAALENGFAAIVRTNAAAQPDETLAEETRQLMALHRDLTARAAFAKPPVRLHPAAHAPTDLYNDLTADPFDEIHDGADIFDAHRLAPQIGQALQKAVPLPCGGHLTIEQTEACVVIDVNTGAFSGTNNYRAAILQTNCEAAAVIAEQLLLRNLSGIIIIDFIDMKDRADKEILLNTLAAEIKKDRIKTELVGMTELGLVQLTRRKTRPPLHSYLAYLTAQTHTKTPPQLTTPQ